MAEGGVHVLPQGNIVYSQPNVTLSNYTPAAVDQYIDVLEFGADGQLFLGTSNLNRRSWTGDIWWFDYPGDAPHRDRAKAGYRIDSGIVRAKFLGNNKILLGLDSGGVLVLSTNTTKHETKGVPFHFFELHPPLCEHDDRITDLDSWKAEGENNLITVGMDSRIVVWDKHLAVLHTYHPAHPTGILSVTCHPSNNSVFATAGLDGTINLWDTREDKPCTRLFSDPMLPPSVISWHPTLPEKILVGTKTGTVFNLDVSSKAVSSQLPVMDREIKTMKWSPARPNLVALSGEDVTVSVLKVEGDDLNIQYSNNSHSDFVHGLAWNPADGQLWSAGWDKQVLHHKLD